ncbi:MAG: YeeE/YedE family protein [Proteobacteria bacterium]|nr:YeeE/YedE family protein [Pseudomonadota bacterium]
MGWLSEVRWSPYAVGIGIGILSWFTFLVSGKALGCSTTFARGAGMIEKTLKGSKGPTRLYFEEYAPVVDWQWMLVLGMVAGGFLSSILSGDFQWQWIPGRWEAAFGTGRLLRVGVAAIGGVILGFGSRWAGGCTSGHGISGTMQLAVSSWISAVCFFIGGVAAARLLF